MIFNSNLLLSNAILGILAGLGGLLLLNLSSWDGFLVMALAFGAAYIRDYVMILYVNFDTKGPTGTTSLPGDLKNMPHGVTNRGGGIVPIFNPPVQ